MNTLSNGRIFNADEAKVVSFPYIRMKPSEFSNFSLAWLLLFAVLSG